MTLIYYLNAPPWSDDDGGALRLHTPLVDAQQEGRSPAVDVAPVADTMVVFRADRIMHEVRPCSRHRLAASVWILAGPAGDEPDSDDSVS